MENRYPNFRHQNKGVNFLNLFIILIVIILMFSFQIYRKASLDQNIKEENLSKYIRETEIQRDNCIREAKEALEQGQTQYCIMIKAGTDKCKMPDSVAEKLMETYDISESICKAKYKITYDKIKNN